MAINREKIKELVEVFYQPVFKTFYINSYDEKTFVKPDSIFVSLGMTTSMKGIEGMRDIILGSGEYDAVIVEISSKRVAGQFINTVINNTDPKQYEVTDFPEGVMNREEAIKEVERMKELLSPDQDLKLLRDLAPKVNQLQKMIDKYDQTDGWENQYIQELDGEYKVFLKHVNYKLDPDTGKEYRIGILVKEKK